MNGPEEVAGTALLVANLALLWSAGIRIATLALPLGPERVIAAVTVGAAVAVISALALGALGLGSQPLALTAVSASLALVTRRRLPAPLTPPRAELAGWWALRGLAGKLLAGAGLGVGLAWAWWVLAEPGLDIDSTLYHLPEVAIWVNEGTPGSVETTNVTFPVGSYPLTLEVLAAWAAGISRNVGAVLLVGPAFLLLLLGALAAILRGLGSRPWVIGLALAVVIGVPSVLDASVRISTDLASVAWLAAAVALALRAARPEGPTGALAFAMVAFGLAVGTKTTVGLVGLLLVGAILLQMRQSLRRVNPRGAFLGGLVAVGAGGFWYIRNFVEHGSPFWPFLAAPWGEPRPESLQINDESFLSNPIGTLEGRTDTYLELLGPTPLLIGAALMLSLATRSRRMTVVALVIAIGAFAWTVSPYTGVDADGAGAIFAFSTIRYLMGVTVLAVVVLALVAGAPGRYLSQLALGTLLVSALWAALALYPGRDAIPTPGALALGAAFGLAVGAGLELCRHALGQRAALLCAGILALVGLLGFSTYPARFLDSYSEHEPIASAAQDSRRLFSGVAGWLNAREAYTEGTDPVFFYPATIGPLTGGSFEHPLELVRPGAECEGVGARLRTQWTVVFIPDDPGRDPTASCFETFAALATFPVTGAGFAGEVRVIGAPPG